MNELEQKIKTTIDYMNAAPIKYTEMRCNDDVIIDDFEKSLSGILPSRTETNIQSEVSYYVNRYLKENPTPYEELYRQICTNFLTWMSKIV